MRVFAFAFTAFLAALHLAEAQEVAESPAIWETAIAEFEARDKESPVAPGGILFLGSSSIRMWELEQSFPDLPVINRGFGGSQVSDSVYYFERVVTPYKPATIVFYAGDNDIAKGKTAETVAADFKAFLDKVWAGFPETRVLFIGIKPSTARWNLYPEMKKANGLIQKMTENEPRLIFVDIEKEMLREDGKPNNALLLKDGLHMTEAGYAIWTRLVLPLLGAPK